MVAIPKQPPKKEWKPDYGTQAYPIEQPKKPKSGPGSYDPNSESAKSLARNTAEKLSKDAKRRRRRFVQRYIIHFNGKRAAMEVGVPERSAAKAASQFLREPYTVMVYEKLLAESEEENLCSRKEVIMGLKREANYYGLDGQSSARVSAWSKLGKYMGMEKGKGDTGNTVHLHFDAQDEDA